MLTPSDKLELRKLLRKYRHICDEQYNARRITLGIPINHTNTKVLKLSLNRSKVKKSYGIDYRLKIDVVVYYTYTEVHDLFLERKNGTLIVPIQKW